MNTQISERFEELICNGEELVKALRIGDHYAVEERMAEYQAWIMSCANLVKLVAYRDSYFIQECDKLLNNEHLEYGIPQNLVKRLLGLMQSMKSEWDQNLIGQIEYIIVAETFDDFLDHAASYHKGNKKMEASVLASVVLEDTIKKIAKKKGLDPSGLSLEQLMDELVILNEFTGVKAKRVKGYAGVRNKAVHAEWDEFDIRDVGDLIKGTRELIEDYL